MKRKKNYVLKGLGRLQYSFWKKKIGRRLFCPRLGRGRLKVGHAWEGGGRVKGGVSQNTSVSHVGKVFCKITRERFCSRKQTMVFILSPV